VDPLIMLAGNNNNKKSAVLHLKKCQVSLKSPKILAFLSFYTNSNCHTTNNNDQSVTSTNLESVQVFLPLN